MKQKQLESKNHYQLQIIRIASLIAILLFVLVGCHLRKGADEQKAVKKNCREPKKIETPCNQKLFAVQINVWRYGRRLLVSYEEPTHQEEFFVNGKKGEYVVGRGNYYETYKSLDVEFDEKRIPHDTLHFSIKMKDALYEIGVLDIKPLNLFWENFPNNYDIEKTEGTTINWYKYADRGHLDKGYFFPKSNTYTGSSIDTLCNPEESIRITPQYVQEITDSEYAKTDSGFVTGVSVKWRKTLYGQITNSKFCGSISASAENSQNLEIKIHGEGKTINGKRVGKWKIYFDKEWNEATVISAEGLKYYRIIDYDAGPPWRITDYYLSGNKQFEGTLAEIPDKLSGFGRYFYEGSNQIESEGNFDSDGKLRGEWKYYHWNGKLKMKGPIGHGKPVGVWELYDEEGKLKKKLNGSELEMEK